MMEGTAGSLLRMLGRNEKKDMSSIEMEMALPFMSLAWKKMPKLTMVSR